jgi:hypothetical protein
MTEYVFSGEDIPFCPGPCSSTQPESKPVKINNVERYSFKPYNGGRYSWYAWPLTGGGTVIVKDIRICPCCNDRYKEMAPCRDGDRVLKKIHDFTPEIEPSGPIDDE